MGFLKKITKPISKVLDKIIPNEVKPFLPYAAAVAPFMAPAGIMGTSMLQRALISGGLNLGAQLAQEGSEGDFNPLSVLLAGGTGALTAPNAAASLRGMTTAGSIDPALGSSAQGDILAGRSFLTKAKDFGLTGLAKGAEGLQGIMTAARDNPFSMSGLKLAAIPTIQGTGDLAYAEGNRQMKAYEKAMAEFNRLQEEGSINSYNDYYSNILKYMDLAGFTTEEAEAAAERVLSEINFANGGRVGFAQGTNKIMMIVDLLNKGEDFDVIKTITEASDEEIMEAVDFFKYGGAEVPLPTFDDKGNMIDDGLYKGRETRPEAKAYGGRIKLKKGGLSHILGV